jgi:hypothetical protein
MKIHPVKDLYEIEIANIKKRNLNQGIGLKSVYPELDTIMGGIGFEPGFIYTIASSIHKVLHLNRQDSDKN